MIYYKNSKTIIPGTKGGSEVEIMRSNSRKGRVYEDFLLEISSRILAAFS